MASPELGFGVCRGVVLIVKVSRKGGDFVGWG